MKPSPQSQRSPIELVYPDSPFMRYYETSAQSLAVSYVARKDGILPSPLFNWRRHMAEGGKQAIEAHYDVVAADEVDRKMP